jgi:hypothetical protein
MDFEEINATLVRLADAAMKDCGLSHNLYVKRFSSAVDREFSGAPAEVLAIVHDIASEFDYATIDSR